MGILANLINKVSETVSGLADKIPGLGLPTRNIVDILGAISDCLYVVNNIFPIDELLTVFGVLITFALTMIAFYWIQRAINLLRGSG